MYSFNSNSRHVIALSRGYPGAYSPVRSRRELGMHSTPSFRICYELRRPGAGSLLRALPSHPSHARQVPPVRSWKSQRISLRVVVTIVRLLVGSFSIGLFVSLDICLDIAWWVCTSLPSLTSHLYEHADRVHSAIETYTKSRVIRTSVLFVENATITVVI